MKQNARSILIKIFALFAISIAGIGAWVAWQIYVFASPSNLVKFALFFPVKATEYPDIPETYQGALRQDVTFKAGSGALLRGIFYDQPGADYVFLLHYGQSGNLGCNIGLGKAVLDSGNSFFAYDYEGYGMSGGKPSIAALLADGVAAHDFLVDSFKVRPEKIIQLGVSMGTGVASHVAGKRRDSRGLVLVSPYTSLKEAARQRFPFLHLYPDSAFPGPFMGSRQFFRDNDRTAVLILHGKNDKVIRVSHAEELFAMSRYPCSLVIGSAVNHGDFSLAFLTRQFRDFAEKLGSDSLGTVASVVSGR